METRYYIPELTEFRLGFNYQVMEQDFPEDKQFLMGTPLAYIQDCLDQGSLRVRLLDESDLEFFGFRRIGNPEFARTGEYIYVHACNYSVIMRYGANSTYIVLRSMEDSLAFPSFSGMCRNRQDLADIIYLLGLHTKIEYVDVIPNLEDYEGH